MTTSSLSQSDIFVFLGPSLCLEDAREILPDAVFMPPVQCGDLVRIMRLKPRVIVIIDGIFERVPAVWHKEILLAMSRGITVVGGGSMGAIRAAELAPMGMVGVGRSFREYADGTLLDDDEVALVHTADGEALSDAMVNIRDTVERGCETGVLGADEGAQLLEYAKAQFYAERTFEGAIQAVLASDRIDAVLTWSRSGGFVDRKREDAKRVLERAASLDAEVLSSDDARPELITGFLRTLARGASCSTQRRLRPDLPHDERVACAARFLGPAYEEIRRLAMLMAAVHDVALTQGCAPTPERPTWAIAASPEWSEAEAVAYGVRMATLEAMVVEHGITDAQIDTNTLHLMRIGGIYDDYRRTDRASTLAAFAEARPNHCRRLRITARLWCVFDRLCEREQLVPRTADLQEFADRFRYVRDLMVRESMDSWLASQDLDSAGFGGLMVAWYRFEHMIGTANLGAFGVPPQAEPVWWLRDALWATGMYGSAQALLRAPTQERCSMPRHDEDAYARDFCDGIASVPVELRAMRDGIMVAL